MINANLSDRGIATITLNRPDLGNRYDASVLGALSNLIDSYSKDPAVRLVVLRGAGRHFCVGADLKWTLDRKPGEGLDPKGPVLWRVLLDLEQSPKPTLAMVHGGCLGGGAALVACCDIVLAETESFFSIPEVRVGLSASSLAPLFIRAIGARQFLRYALVGDRFSAETAAQIGLIHHVMAKRQMEPFLDSLIDGLLLGGPFAIAATKALVGRLKTPVMDVSAVEALEAKFGEALRSPEAIEGLRSFLEKRKPSWYPGALGDAAPTRRGPQ